MKIPTESKARKSIPIFTGFLAYFPDAIAEVAACSQVGNDQHNPGTPLHWDRAKSGDEKDALCRHLLEAGTFDTDGVRHSTKAAWRALANLQKEIESEAKDDGTGPVQTELDMELTFGDHLAAKLKRLNDADMHDWDTAYMRNR